MNEKIDQHLTFEYLNEQISQSEKHQFQIVLVRKSSQINRLR